MSLESEFNLLTALKGEFALMNSSTFRNELSVTVAPHTIVPLLDHLKNKRGFHFLMDLCGVHYPERSESFEVVYHLFNLDRNQRIRIKVPLSENESIPSAVRVFKGANWFEREAYDMIGIRFDGHPNLTRILTHHEFVGHPLRKDYAPDKNQILERPLEYETPAALESAEDPVLQQRRYVNLGPSHPAMHGTFRLFCELEGEIIRRASAEIGYLHRCFEKMSETHTYHQVIPYTDRLNYCSAPLNNSAYCRAVEKLLGIEIPARAKVVRIIFNELARIIDHFVCLGAQSVDSGALTNFWYFFQGRERVYTLFEQFCGARMLVNMTRIGGMVGDFPPGWIEECKDTVNFLDRTITEINRSLTNNPIWVRRLKGLGAISKADAIEYGFTGPCLRACGVPYDLRKLEPYDGYDQFDFDIPVGNHGDNYDRYLVRIEEMFQSLRIIRQAIEALPSGPTIVDDPLVAFPPKQEVYTNIEALMNHFKLVMHGIQPPKGEIYSYSEAANGELGFYIVSDGTKNPYRIKVRPPCFAIYQPFEQMVVGETVSDAVLTLGSLNIIAGELDR